jgi:hypothetical protein
MKALSFKQKKNMYPKLNLLNFILTTFYCTHQPKELLVQAKAQFNSPFILLLITVQNVTFSNACVHHQQRDSVQIALYSNEKIYNNNKKKNRKRKTEIF